MSAERDLAQAIADAVDAKVAGMRPQSSTMPATYQGRDSEGKGWVLLPGATEPTPVSRMAVEAAQGDTVSVTIANGKATVDSNVSNPSAGIAGVKTVERTANAANETASNALVAATDARSAASSAQASADTARQAATDATVDAATARSMAESATADAATASESAAIAKTSADKATYALSDVENVVGTLNWIAEHGEYVLTSDTAIVEGKAYYTRSGTDPDYVYTVVASPDASELSTYYELELDESVQNYLASHLWLDNYGLNLSVDSANGYRVHQGTVDGTHSAGAYIIDPQGAIVASFGAGGFQVGLDGESHLIGDFHSLQLIDKNGSTYFHVSDLRGSDGYADVSESFTADGTTLYFTVTYSIRSAETTTVTIDSTQSSFQLDGRTVVLPSRPAQGAVVSVSYQSDDGALKAYTLGTRFPSSVVGPYSMVLGRVCKASGKGAIAAGVQTEASGEFSFAEGDRAKAFGQYAHAEGSQTTASGKSSHAEGQASIASGMYSHAEGYSTKATGHYSHAEGDVSQAGGQYSHAQNLGTKASSASQTALGKYNVEDANGDYAVIVGNGTADNKRSNALTVGWDGSVVAAGDVTATDSGGNAHKLTEKAASVHSHAASDIASGTLPVTCGGTGAATVQAARASLNVVACSDQANMGAYVGKLGSANQIWDLVAKCINSNNPTRDGHTIGLLMLNDGIGCYDWNGGGSVWKLGALTTTTTTISNIISAASGITISSAAYSERNGVATLNIAFKRTATTTGNFNIGTMVSGKRPAITTYGAVTSTAIIWVNVQSGGTVQAYANAATGAGNTYYCSFTYVLA